MMKKINAQLENDRRHYAAILPPPATAEELRQCQRELKKRCFMYMPQRYFAFLRNGCNGYNLGACFYGTKPLKIYNSSDLADDIVTANEKSSGARFGLFEIGYGHHHNYYYNFENGLYQTKWMTGWDLAREYENFADMFSYETAHFDYYG
jgi:hypothetical protein